MLRYADYPEHPQTSAIPVKIPTPWGFFVVVFAEIEKCILKFTWSLKGPQAAKNNFEKENELGGLTLPDFKTH